MNSNFRNKKTGSLKDCQGFTILEVLISIFLLAVISLSIYQATTESYRLRDVLLRDGDFYNGIRLAMNLMQRDIAVIYSPTIMLPDKKGPQPPADGEDMLAMLSGDSGRSTQFWSPAVDKTGVRPSRFVGTENKLTFVSLSHIRVYKDTPESQFAKISYELVPDTSEGAISGTNVLVKKENFDAFDNEENKERTKTYPLLRGITKLRYRFYDNRKDRWEGRWDTESSDFKNFHPTIVEAEVEVKGAERLTFEGKYQMKLEIPLDGLDPSF